MSFTEEEKVSIKSIIENQNIRLTNYDTFCNFTIMEGKVKAYSKPSGKYVALKSLYDYKYFVNELQIINAVNCHDNIIDFYGVCMDPSTETYYLGLQYAKDGNLGTYLRKNFEELDWETKIDMAKDLASGLQFIHQANIIHRDLNPNNILVHNGRLLIANFELSRSLDSDSDFSDSIESGEVTYTDPEYLRNPKEYNRDKASDIYSLGVLFWELSSGNPPFYNMRDLDILYIIKSGGRETSIQGTPFDYVNIYSRAWNQNPIQRPTIENIYNSLEKIDISLEYIENIEKFEKDSVSSNSSNSGIIDCINNTYGQASSSSMSLLNLFYVKIIFYSMQRAIYASVFEKSEPMGDIPKLANCGITDINDPYKRASPKDHGEASTSHNFNAHEWFDDIIKNNEIIKYNYDVFKDLDYIGRGGFGSIDSATLIDEKIPKMRVALKSIVVSVDDIKLFLMQHSKVGSHENIIDFYGVSQKDLNSNEYILVLEYANGGTLRDYLESNFKNLEWSDKLNFAKQIAKAIKHLHSHDVIHRDLHPENILIHNNIIKISDFGLAKLISDPSITLLSLAGSIEYSDPMLLIEWDKFKRTKASDLYSFGILLWEISSGKKPYNQYKTHFEKKNHIVKGNRETPVKGTPQDYINIYQDCWKQEPNQRPNIDEVMQVLEHVNVTFTKNALPQIENGENSDIGNIDIKSFSKFSNSDQHNIPFISEESFNTNIKSSSIENELESVSKHNSGIDTQHKIHEITEMPPTIEVNEDLKNFLKKQANIEIKINDSFNKSRIIFKKNNNNNNYNNNYDSFNDRNSHVSVSSTAIIKAADVNLPDVFQDFIISARLWAKVKPLPNNKSNLKFSINVNDCRMGPMLSDKWPKLRKLGFGYLLDSVEIRVTPIRDESRPNKPLLYKVKDGPWPKQPNREIYMSEICENSYGIDASISNDPGFTLNYGRRNEQGFNFKVREWELNIEDSCETGLCWKYQYTADDLQKNLNDRRSFAPGEHSCHWMTLEAMSGFRITITQVLRCKITNGWQKLKPNTKSNLMLICPKMSHTLEISFNSLENFDENFKNWSSNVSKNTS
ncbi:hypothetical protein Glove_130g8 [Diversispora epigaea]|uniref:Protein kinase domain-containing protein n=1 Tax=Diversispora epigaea TaxID=1348612 RepID=A0A397IY34_9GLOM|nr:hypothetical protein Glove_130g8 [Diversispora epigaea]